MMAAIGELILIVAGIVLLVAGIIATGCMVALAGWTWEAPIGIAWALIGIGLIWCGIHYGPIEIHFQVAAVSASAERGA